LARPLKSDVPLTPPRRLAPSVTTKPPAAASPLPPKGLVRPLKDELRPGAKTGTSAVKLGGGFAPGSDLPSGPAVKAHTLSNTGNQFPEVIGTPSTTAPVKTAPSGKVKAATAAFDAAVKKDKPLEATKLLDDTLRQLPPEDRGPFLDGAHSNLQALTSQLPALDGPRMTTAVKNLSRATDAAGPVNAEKLTRPIATAIADGKLERTGDAANAGVFGAFRGANTHHSERQLVEGLKDLGQTPGAELFRSALTKSLSDEAKASTGARADRAAGFAGAVVTGDAGLVPDHGVWTGLRNAGQDVASKVDGAVQKVEALKAAAVDAALDRALGVSSSIESLKPGDTLTIGASGAVSAALDVEAGGQVEVKRNADGSYSVRGQATGTLGLGVLKDHGGAGLTGKVEFTFANLDQATRGTKTLLQTGAAAAGTPLAGAGLLATPDGESLRNLTSHLSAVELDGAAEAALDARFGLSNVLGAGAEGKVRGEQGLRVEFADGKPSAIVAKAQLKGEGTAEASKLLVAQAAGQLRPEAIEDFKARFGFDPREVNGVAAAEGGITVELRTPISTTPVASGNAFDQVKAIVGNPARLVTGAPTASVEVDAWAKVRDAGFGATYTANLQPSQLPVFLDGLKKGDVKAAADRAGLGGVVSSGGFRDESRGWSNHALDVGLAGVEGRNSIRRAGPQRQYRYGPGGSTVPLGPTEYPNAGLPQIPTFF